MEEEVKYIDIEKIIKEGDSVFLKSLPKFVIRAFAWVIKQQEVNRILNTHAENVGVEFLPKMVKEFNLNIEIEGEENLPEQGKCFFAANHPFGVIDGLLITYIVSRKYGTLKAIGNEAFMFVPQLRPLIAAVNVFGKSSKEYLMAIEETYQSDTPITHFPAGLVSRLHKGKVEDVLWQKSFITKSISSKRDIVPIHFSGRNSRLFYFIYLVRQLSGIKMNIELMLLPREMLRKRNKTIRVKIGKPIPYTTFDHSLSHKDWAEKVRAYVYKLGRTKGPVSFN